MDRIRPHRVADVEVPCTAFVISFHEQARCPRDVFQFLHARLSSYQRIVGVLFTEFMFSLHFLSWGAHEVIGCNFLNFFPSQAFLIGFTCFSFMSLTD